MAYKEMKIMFEFHGWINVQCVENEKEAAEQTYMRQSKTRADIYK